MAKTFYLRWNKNDLPTWTKDPEKAFLFGREETSPLHRAAYELMRAFPGEVAQEYYLVSVKIHKPGMKGYGWGIAAKIKPAQSVDDDPDDGPWADLDPDRLGEWQARVQEVLGNAPTESEDGLPKWELAMLCAFRQAALGTTMAADGISSTTYFESAIATLADNDVLDVDPELQKVRWKPKKRKQ